MGVGCAEGASLTLSRAALLDNRTAGLVVYGEGTKAEVSGLLVEGTLAAESTGLYGTGVVAFDPGATLAIGGAVIRGSRIAGILVADATAAIEGAVVEGTTVGSTEDLTNLADGLAARDAVVDAKGLLVRWNERAGVVAVDSEGTFSRLVSIENAVGLALQGEPLPVLLDSVVSAGNGSDTPALDLPISSDPFPVPPPR
jgi:hypothetical protein